MKGSPAFQFYPADYLADENVMLMTLEEEGAYIRAMSYCWREGSIPANEDQLSRLLKNAPLPVVRRIMSLFEPRLNGGSEIGGRLVHPRLEREREKQRLWSEKSRSAGIKSGEVRKQKHLTVEPTANGGSSLVEPKANSSFSSSSSSSKETPLPPTGERETDASIGARMLCEMIGDRDVRNERAYSDAIKTAVNLGKDARDEAQHMLARWNEYQAAKANLEWGYGSAYKFFMSGMWDKPDQWAWAKGKRPHLKARKYAEVPGREA